MKIADAVFVYQLSDERLKVWHGRRHAHQGALHECHYFVAGEGSFRNGTATWPIRSGDIHFTAPGVEHRILPAPGGAPITYYAVLLDACAGDACVGDAGEDENPGSALADLLARLSDASHAPRHIGTSHRFFFADLVERHFSGSRDLGRAAFHQYLSLLHSIAGGNPSGASTADNVHVEKSLAIFHRCLETDLDLDEVSARLGLSREHFARLFAARMGMPPMKYFRRLKVEAACAMLAGGTLPVGAIADKLAFRDQFAFSRTFRAVTGESPSEYRARCGRTAGIGYSPDAGNADD